MRMLFASVVRARRLELGLSAAEVARFVGVRPETLAAWETGRRMPRTSRIASLADALHLDAEALLEIRHCSDATLFAADPGTSFRAGRGTVRGWGGTVLVRG